MEKELSETENAVEIRNCQIKMSKQGHRMEALLKGASTMSSSKKTFDLDNDRAGKPISVAEVEKMPEYTRVTDNSIIKVLVPCLD